MLFLDQVLEVARLSYPDGRGATRREGWSGLSYRPSATMVGVSIEPARACLTAPTCLSHAAGLSAIHASRRASHVSPQRSLIFGIFGYNLHSRE